MLRIKLLVFVLTSALVLTLSVMSPSGGAATPKTTSNQPATKEPTRRALLIGINNYDSEDPVPAQDQCTTAAPAKAGRRSKRGTGAKAGFATLEGPRNDVCAVRDLLINTFHFEPANILVLREKEATRDGIIKAFNELITKSAPGDSVLFFYSGHGSQVKNSLGGESDKLDETMVPIDWKRPIEKREDARDIRDKEIFKLFKEAAKKVTLTALFDSCHSGGISRGGVNEEIARTGPDELKFDFAEPPAEDQKDVSDEEYLENSGVLVISAARDDQEAKEKSFDEVWRGNFTYSLKQVLQTPGAENLSAARLFDRVVVQMKSNKASHEPVIWGSATRRQQTLFGSKVDPTKRSEVNVESVDVNGRITLQGGRAVGLNKNCEFVKKGDENKPNAVRIRITADPDYVKSVAEVIAKDAATAQKIAETIKPNDTFVLEKWASSGEPNLVVWIPPAQLTDAQLKVAAQEIVKLGQGGRVQLVADPTTNVATYFLSHDGTNWLLKLPDNEVVTIGATLTAKSVLDKLPSSGNVSLFYSLPPSKDLAAQIKLGDGTNNSAVGVTKTRQDAHYWLVGRARTEAADTVLEYAWLLPEATVGVAKAGDPNAAEVKASNAGVSPLPALTDWKANSTDLENLALRLGKIRGWVKLDSPQGNSGGFAYRLVLKNCKGDVENCKGDVLSGRSATMVDGEIFSLSLLADESLLQGTIAQRHVYVFSLDKNGKSELMYPDLSNADTKLPYVSATSEVKKEIELAKLRICGPDVSKSGCRSPGVLGPETYVMLTTVEKLPDPTVLESEGVRTSEEIARDFKAKGIRGEESPLMDLLTGIGSTSRNERVVPLNWSVQQVFFRSVEKKP